MNRVAAVSLVAALSVAPLAPAQAVQCHVQGPDASIGYERGNELVFKRNRKVIARISDAYVLTVDDKVLTLTPEQRFAVATYRASYDILTEEAKEVGLAGARLGVRAATGVLVALLSGKVDEFERDVEADAAVIEARAETLCALAETLEQQHAELVRLVPEFGQAFSSNP